MLLGLLALSSPLVKRVARATLLKVCHVSDVVLLFILLFNLLVDAYLSELCEDFISSADWLGFHKLG